MKCPACNNTLEARRYKQHVLDFCAACAGVWFDEGELRDTVQELIANKEVDYQTVKEAFEKKPIPLNRQDNPVRKCPKCGTDMAVFNYAYDSNIFVDRCPSCNGIWTDSNEIIQIAKHTKGNPKVTAMGDCVAQAHMKQVEFKQRTQSLNMLNERVSLGQLLLAKMSIFPIPLKDDNPIRITPIATFALIFINALVFIYQSFFVQDMEVFVAAAGLAPANAFEPVRLFAFFSSMFVHGGWMHLLGNMYFLWLFGDNIEDEWGSAKFLLFYLGCGIVGSMLFVLTHPFLSVPAVGASGAISGLLGAYLVLYPDADVYTFWLGKVRSLSAFGYLLFWACFQLLFGVLELNCVGGGCAKVGYWAHIGGFFCGAAVAYSIKKIKFQNKK